ncbi:hypothetical protein BDY24DRAFT_60517 [Mrakia frigida]|uniref:uncharacterized protein n=1 Tax=Mrakia frigida TaxID=29902 RepID=UPI003FCC0BC5
MKLVEGGHGRRRQRRKVLKVELDHPFSSPTAILPLPLPFPFSNPNTIHNQLYLSPESDVSSPPSPSRSPGTNPLLRLYSSRLSFLLLFSHLLQRPPRSSSPDLPPPPHLQGSSSTRSSSLLLHHRRRPRKGLVDLPLSRKKGLLVGEDNEERASFVKELWIDIDYEACIPIDPDHICSFLEHVHRPDRISIELERATLPHLDLLLLFRGDPGRHRRRSNGVSSSGPRNERVDEIWWEVVNDRVLFQFWLQGRAQQLEERGEEVFGVEWENYLTAEIQRLYRETDMPSPDELEEQVSSEREEAWGLFIDPDFPPRRVDMTLDGLGEDLLLQLYSSGLLSTSDLPFVALPPAGLNLNTKEDAGTVAATFREDLDHLSFALKHSLMFEDFPQSFWELIKNGPEIVWGEEWTWRREDGTVVRVKETFGRSEV